MEVSVETVMEAALQLPVSGQLEVASRLLETITPDDGLFDIDDPELLAELDRRFADNSECIPWNVIRQERASSEH
jgi:hypothetical protein